MTDDLKAPERICYVNCGLPDDQCVCYQYAMSRDPAADRIATLEAALADMTQQRDAAMAGAQALITANYRKLVAEITGNPSGTKCDACRACGYYHCTDAFYGCAGMRDYTLEEALAALSRIEAQAETRGMRKAVAEIAPLLSSALASQEAAHTEDFANAMGERADGIELSIRRISALADATET